jgi:hypothetical protein
LAFQSSRPTYGIVLLLISGFFLCATFLPFLYSIAFPNENLQKFLSALKGSEPSPLDSDTVVQQAIAAAGTLKRTIPIGYSYQVTRRIHYAGAQAPEEIKASQAIHIAWFRKRPEPMLVAFTCYASGDGQTSYQITQVSPLVVLRGYGVPLCFFGLSLVLARRRKAPASAQRNVPVQTLARL